MLVERADAGLRVGVPRLVVPEVVGGQVVDGVCALRRHRGVKRRDAVVLRPDDLQEGGRLQGDQRLRVVAEEHLEEAKVGLGELGVHDDLLHGHVQAQLQRHRQRVLQRLVVVEREHAEVDVVAREGRGEQVEDHGHALVLLLVQVVARRGRRAEPPPVGHRHLQLRLRIKEAAMKCLSGPQHCHTLTAWKSMSWVNGPSLLTIVHNFDGANIIPLGCVCYFKVASGRNFKLGAVKVPRFKFDSLKFI
mmetsp:Transcript_14456/g.19963  ORF Transcript_14456/g.19963 Transcript_14456/m.19963 type:complete len:248 (-) Transcript_14456:64-807(-)